MAGRRGRNDDVQIVVASAAEVRLFDEDPEELSERAKRVGVALGWQHEAWKWYGRLGEVWYSHAWKGNAIGGLHWLIGVPDPETGDVVPARGVDGTLLPGVDPGLFELAQDALDRLVGPNGSHAEWARPLGTAISCVAEGWLVGYHVDADGDPVDGVLGDGEFIEENPDAVMVVWDACSPTELERITGDDNRPRLKMQRTAEGEKITLPRDALAVRIWRRHPRWSEDADGPMEPLIDVCEDLYLLRMSVRGSALSRTHAGILLIPTEGLGQPLSTYANQQAGGQASGNAGGLPPNPVVTNLIAGLTTPHKDPASASAVVPTTITTKAEHIEKWRHLPLVRDIDPAQKEQREELIRAYATGIDLPPERLLGMADLNHWCVDDSTEVLTRRGWLHQGELIVGDEALAYDTATGTTRWSPVRDIYRADVAAEPMVRMTMGGHSSLTTAHHRWPTAGGDWRTSSTLRETDRLVTGAPSEHPGVAKWSDALVELAGWLWTEGWVSGAEVRIAQSDAVNPGRVARIRAALTAEFGPDSFTEYRQRAALGRGEIVVFRPRTWAARALLEACGGKHIEPAFVHSLTAAQLALFIDVSCQGDGQHYRSGRLDIWQDDPTMLDAFELAGVLAGYAVTRSDDGHRVNLAAKTTVRPIKAHRHAVRHGRTPLVTVEMYAGTIWCPVTDEQTWVARRDGAVFVTGNTAWQVGEDSWRHVDPDAQVIAGGITSGYLWSDMLAALEERNPALQITSELLEAVRMFRVTYDPTAVIISPDRSDDADDAFDRGAISWKAYRRYKHIPEGDAPSAEELEERALLGFGGRSSAPPAGPGDVSEGPAASERPAAAHVDAMAIERRRSVRASLRVTGTMERYARACARIENTFLRDVLLAVDSSVDEAVRKAQARLRSIAQRDPQLRGRIAGVRNGELVSIIGKREVARLRATTFEGEEDATAEGMFAGSLVLLMARYHDLSTAAQAEWRRLVGEQLNVEFDADELAQLEADLTASGPVLESGARLAAEAAFIGAGAAVLLDGPGEIPAGVTIPPVVVRRAAARAGGAPVAGGITPMAARWEGGLTSGPTIDQFLGRRGFVPAGMMWAYGDASSRKTPFGPHEDLNMTEVATLADFEPFWPGDHNGCQCQIARMYVNEAGDTAEILTDDLTELLDLEEAVDLSEPG